MTTYTTFASSFRFLSTPNVTDVNTLISDFRSETVTNGSPAWTEPTSQNFKSPVDSAGRFFTVILTRTAATRLEWKVTDQNAVTICDREIDIASGTTVNYYTGQSHAWIESVATPEYAAAGILDSSPLSVGSYAICVYGSAFRTTAGGNDGSFDTTGKMFMIDSTYNRMRAMGVNFANQTMGGIDSAGNQLFIPCEFSCTVSGNVRWHGKVFQAFLCDNSCGVGSVKTVVIGTAGEVGTFRIIGLGASENLRLMLRTA